MSQDKEKDAKRIALKYSGLVTAVLGGASLANGQVRYVDIADITLDENNATFDLNIDNDTSGIVDYRIIQYVDTTDFKISGSFIQARGVARNQVVGLDYANYYYPFRLNLGDTIGPDTVFKGLGTSRNWGQLGLSINDTTYPHDQFDGGVTDGFIGLRLRAERNDTLRNFYGWLRVDLAADLKSITIKDYAIQENFEEPIAAGEGLPAFNLAETERPRIELFQRGRSIAYQIEEADFDLEARLKVFTIAGRQLADLALKESEGEISMAEWPKGFLVVRLEMADYAESIRAVVY